MSDLAQPDRLIIHEVAVECRLGVYEWERQTPQRILIDLELAIDAAEAAARDDVAATVDYGDLVTAVKQLTQSKTYRLLETMAEDISAMLLQRVPTKQVWVRVKKRALPNVGYAAVEIVRPVGRFGADASADTSQRSAGFPTA